MNDELILDNLLKNNFYFSEEQKIIIEDSSRIKLINGCAGSRKTDTIIKNGIINLIKNKQNILYITFKKKQNKKNYSEYVSFKIDLAVKLILILMN